MNNIYVYIFDKKSLSVYTYKNKRGVSCSLILKLKITNQ